ncbi:MAG TPA: ATP-binding protein [Candidatus Limnocylindria bacterium]|nr:ATP-binding protein [Candidatus Limnocylindria bacterium]
MPRTIGARLLLASIASLVISLAVLAVAAPLAARQHETDTTGTRLAGDAAVVAELAREQLAGNDASSIDHLAKRIGAASGTRITIIARDGTVLGESDEDPRGMENHAGRPEVAAALAGGPGRSIRASATVGRDLLYVAVPVRSDGRVVGVARAALPLATLEALASSLAGAILAAGLAGAVAAAAVAFVLERAITRPLVDLTRRASAGEAESGAFAVGGPEEVRRLGAALGSMAEAARAARRGVESERDRLATVLTELTDAVLIVDADDRVRLANPAAERMLDAGALAGRRVVEVVRDHEVFEAIREARQGRDSHAQIERDAPRRLVRVVARPLQGGQLLLSLQDLTTLQRLETVRRDFVANVSHELRTPIAALAAIAETLDAGAIDDPDAARDFVRRMQAEIGGLAQLVEELLSLARIESGAEPLQLAPVAPARLVADAARRMAALADRAGVRLEVAATDAPDVLADAEKVGQVLANLVHNAVKFTPPGGQVTLAAQPREGAIAFSVRDTGAGIEASALPRIFERFYKSDRSRATGGTGLGLAIAKHIVQAHRGDITATSDGPGRGATFTFTLPRA